ncbi:MAG: tRNA epoxyqueuosine(34) reductase QueG [Gammaproteobacteria bacterium]
MFPNLQEKDQLLGLAVAIKGWAMELGFQQLGIADVELYDDEKRLCAWLAAGQHGTMEYMARHGTKRSRPKELLPGTLRVLCVRMNYGGATGTKPQQTLGDPGAAYVARYAVGRDYHKVLRTRLRQLVRRIQQHTHHFGYRIFVDSAPVLEKALARNAGLGWIGKHTNLINRGDGSWFFLGEIFTDLPLPPDQPAQAYCGSCQACLNACPTKAIKAPYELDARRCIAYLTIELRSSIPVELRPLMGNRIFGCDDCQLVCPWNRAAPPTLEADFAPRHALDTRRLLELFHWSEEDFNLRTQGSPLRRIGYPCWLRNIAVALGNTPTSRAVVEALEHAVDNPSELVREHVRWALSRHRAANTTDRP